MTNYGFRLFDVELHLGNARKLTPFFQEKDGMVSWTLVEYLQEVLEAQIGGRERGVPHRERPTDEEDDASEVEEAPLKTEPLLSIIKVSTVGDHLLFLVRYGRPAGHDLAMADPSDGDEDVDIARHAPSRVYRVVLLVPQQAAGRGILAVESVGLACPATPCVRWLTYWSKAHSSQLAQSNGSTPTWWRMRIKALGDNDRLQHLAQRATPAKIKLQKFVVTSDNKRAQVDLELSSLVKANERQEVAGKVMEWLRRKVTPKDAASEIAKVVGHMAENADFDDVTVQLEDDDGRLKSITASALNDIFTYPISSKPVENTVLLSYVRGAVESFPAGTLTGTYAWDDWPLGRN